MINPCSLYAQTLRSQILGPEGGDSLCAIAEAAFDHNSAEEWTAPQLRAALTMTGVAAKIFYEPDQSGDFQMKGFWLGRFICDEAELLLIATHRAWRRQSVGKYILHDFINHAAITDCPKLFLEVRVGNIAARKLYESAGFHRTGQRPNYYRTISGSLEDALNMSLSLVTSENPPT